MHPIIASVRARSASQGSGASEVAETAPACCLSDTSVVIADAAETPEPLLWFCIHERAGAIAGMRLANGNRTSMLVPLPGSE
jgi:hypothetical protein